MPFLGHVHLPQSMSYRYKVIYVPGDGALAITLQLEIYWGYIGVCCLV
ncbi:protein of unknown function [Xenorhabdus doucetiae]|uniref:Uncharacterized protein n=1 Tax=Xenorhabdus doucetiae TaxID=351671 RepID=A0A068QUM3_9GAMM|nr:protein of unknown function [Xenorhabdus doucetiae]